jgi:methylenetetrahydrofolate dehydrogenase (NADP+)/methenyltetrahydrofolate cyclohydrolase
MAVILEAKKIGMSLKINLKQKIGDLAPLTLASLNVGGDYSTGVYLASQKKVAQELGVDYLSIELPEKISQNEVIDKIRELNKDNKVTGIIVNRPFPSHWKEEIIFDAIDYKKDIEGINAYNLGKLFLGKAIFISPTVLSVLEFLKSTGINLYGKEVVVIGFSAIIGKPLAILLGNMFATVNITHIGTYESGRLPFYVNNADIVISAVGKPHLIKGEWIKEDAVVIDVGTGEKDGKLTGDVEFDAAEEKASFITPVPGGVGKLTPLFLYHNLVIAAQLLKDIS